jgi:hypothetical protein
MHSQIALHGASPTPAHVTKRRSQNRWRNSCTDTSSVTTVASDQAFVDVILDNDGAFLTDNKSLSPLIHISSKQSRQKQVDSTRSMSVRYTHGLFYKQELVFVLETTSHCDVRGTWGQSSSCVLTGPCVLSGGQHLRVNITKKGRKADGSGWNARETRTYSLADLIEQSAQARQNEVAQDSLP